MKAKKFFVVPIALFLLVAACAEEPRNLQPLRAETAVVAATAITKTPSRTPTQTPSSTNTPISTLTVAPTDTAVPTTTPTPQASNTPEPTPFAGLPCPDPPPAKPEYAHQFLSPTQWPDPSTAPFQPHFWLSDPIATGRKPFEQAYYPYGWDGGQRFLLHNGADMPKELGTAVLAAANGTVIVAQSDQEMMFGWRCDWYGQLVILELDERWQNQPVYILYGHVQNLKVQPGDRIEQGDAVAEIGVEGVSTVPHLHMEVRIGRNEFSATQNPLLWLDPGEASGVLAGRLVDPEKRPWQGIRLTLIDSSGEEPEFISTFSYLDDPQHIINPDDQLAENFVFSDMPAGFYTLFTQIQGVDYRVPVEIKAGEVTAVEIITHPYQTPTPQAEP